MKYIVTGGAMAINVDDVRKIINSSTGKLALKFIDKIALESKDIVFIHTDNLTFSNDKIKNIEVKNPQELLNALKAEITDNSVIIHLMAVSDFAYQGSIDIDKLISQFIAEKEKINSLNDGYKIIEELTKTGGKLSSEKDVLLYMKREIKVVDEIKKVNKACFLVSFKLLSNVNEETLIEVATNQKIRTNSDIVVGNIMNDISFDKHKAIVITENKKIRVETKDEIVNEVLKSIKEQYE